MSRPFILDPLFQSTQVLPGVGPRFVKLLEKNAGPKVADLLWMLPQGVIDRRYEPSLPQAQPGLVATLRVVTEAHFPPKRPGLPYKVKCRGADGRGFIDLSFFNVKGDYLEKQLPVGEERVVSGRLELYGGALQIAHPDYIVKPEERDTLPAIEAIYPLTAGLTQKTVQKIARAAVARAPILPEWNDAALMAREKWPAWRDALKALHAPEGEEALSPLYLPRQRLAYDEVLASQLALLLVRRQHKRGKGRPLAGDPAVMARARAALPFTLTGAQERAVAEIAQDMQSGEKMLRLLQGDVGSGKTAVAFLAMAQAVAAGAQAAIMAPTEILARQHARTLGRFAGAAGLRIAVLTGRDKGRAREGILSDIASGAADIVVGTHALFQDDVAFKDLGLVVVDEQHRFGVHQRLQLSGKGSAADVLVMTATPIPRTLALTAYGDMDVSRLDEKPPGREPIETRVVSSSRLEEVAQALERKFAAGERAYWVCPLVEESEKIDLAAAEERFQHLSGMFPGRVGLLHGRMKPAEKDAAMEAFSQGALDLLVSTTVIEVGVDVPEATVMVIEHAGRFGLAQLHQLRGRVGRGPGRKSACILLADDKAGEAQRRRLAVMRETEDGFLIAEEDLKLRGPGEVLGTRQSGLEEFRIARLEAHARLIDIARDDARLILEKDPALTSPRGEALRALLYLFERDMAIKYLRSG